MFEIDNEELLKAKLSAYFDATDIKGVDAVVLIVKHFSTHEDGRRSASRKMTQDLTIRVKSWEVTLNKGRVYELARVNADVNNINKTDTIYRRYGYPTLKHVYLTWTKVNK